MSMILRSKKEAVSKTSNNVTNSGNKKGNKKTPIPAKKGKSNLADTTTPQKEEPEVKVSAGKRGRPVKSQEATPAKKSRFTPKKEAAAPTSSTRTTRSSARKSSVPKSDEKAESTPTQPAKSSNKKSAAKAIKPEAATPTKAVKSATQKPNVTPKAGSKSNSEKNTPVKNTSTKKDTTASKADSKATSENNTPAKIIPAKKATSSKSNSNTIPSFSIKNHKDETVDLGKLVKTTGLVIFVYPRASTPGCTNQVCFFRDSLSKFENLGYRVFGLSNDPPKKNNTFATKQNITYDLLCDEKEELLKFIGAKNGSKIIRSCIVIQRGGEILDKNIKVSPIQSLDWALELIRNQGN